MDEMHAALDRLERRIENQAAKIDAVFEELERRGILPRTVGASRGDALSDGDSQAPDLYSVWRQKAPPRRRQPTRFHVGQATGV